MTWINEPRNAVVRRGLRDAGVPDDVALRLFAEGGRDPESAKRLARAITAALTADLRQHGHPFARLSVALRVDSRPNPPGEHRDWPRPAECVNCHTRGMVDAMGSAAYPVWSCGRCGAMWPVTEDRP